MTGSSSTVVVTGASSGVGRATTRAFAGRRQCRCGRAPPLPSPVNDADYRGSRRGPPIGGHRLLNNGRSLALVTASMEIDWWCAPELDSPPLLWSLLDQRGAAARWVGARYASTTGPPAGPMACVVVVVDGFRVAYRGGLLDIDGTACLVRLVRSDHGEVRLRHRLAVGGFARPWGVSH